MTTKFDSKSSRFEFRTLNRKPKLGDSIVAIYRKGAKRGDMPLWVGARKNTLNFLNSVK